VTRVERPVAGGDQFTGDRPTHCGPATALNGGAALAARNGCLANGDEHPRGNLTGQPDLVGTPIDAYAVAFLRHGHLGTGVDTGDVQLVQHVSVGLHALEDPPAD